ncbi:MAG: DUF1080 domain-containing protein [Verrucomicrobiota bacterium]|nr:DUF1080 domain-containing protein [Verrucomicrobiota bacterium]
MNRHPFYTLAAAFVLCLGLAASHAQEKKTAEKKTAEKKTAEKKAEDWKPLFDGKTLEGWKPTDFGGRGEVTVAKGQIVLGAGSDITGVNYTREVPKTNYEVALEAMRVEGSDFMCGLTLPVGDAHFTFIAGGWGGGVVGISSVNGDDASENETTQIMKFDKGRWYKIRVRVTPEKIEAWIDNEQMVNLELAGKTISMRAGEIEQSAPFGIATYQTEAAFRDIKLRALPAAPDASHKSKK